MADIFAIGVSLYIMVTRGMPFGQHATKEDTYYKYIVYGRELDYWKYSKQSYHLSASLKQLLTFLFQFHPGMRLSLAEIIAHPWVQDPDCPSPDQVRDYFLARKHFVDKKADESLKEDIKKYNDAAAERQTSATQSGGTKRRNFKAEFSNLQERRD